MNLWFHKFMQVHQVHSHHFVGGSLDSNTPTSQKQACRGAPFSLGISAAVSRSAHARKTPQVHFRVEFLQRDPQILPQG